MADPITPPSQGAPASRAATRNRRTIVGPAARIAPHEVNTLVLFPTHREFLSVRVFFHRAPVPGLAVRLVTLEGVEVAAQLETNEHGVAQAPRRVPAGVYICEVERQERVEVSTVPLVDRAFPVVLPVGRPYLDIRAGPSFGEDRG